MTKADIYEFIKEHTLLVIATQGEENQPNAAVTAFGITPEWEIVIGTSLYSRKYANIQHNPKVALVIGWDEDQTVQTEGLARIPTDAEMDIYKAVHLDQNPWAVKFSKDPKNTYFVVQLEWLRFTDISESPEYVKEIHIP
jgi:pyridoxine/pyridoxamine 5'-phosphate oxidase